MTNLLRLVRFLQHSTTGATSRGRVVLVIVTGVVAGLASTGLIAVINEALSQEAGDRERVRWIFAGLCVLLPLARFSSQYLLIRLSQGVTYDLRVELSHKLLGTSLRRLEALGPARLLATLTDDISRIANALANIPMLCLHTTVVVGALGYMAWLSWPLFLLVLGALAVGVASYRMPLSWALSHLRRGREGWDRLVGHFRGMTEGTKELQIHRARRAGFMTHQLQPEADVMRHHNVRGNTIYALANSWGQVLFFVLIGLILFVLSGEGGFGSSVVRGYTLAILYLLTPLDVILNLLPGMGQAVVAVDKVVELGVTLEDRPLQASEAPLDVEPRAWERLELAGVTHRYLGGQDEEFQLGPVDLQITPGELLFIVGGNGSGKTTLAKIILGLYEPESGTLRLDGEEVGNGDRDDYRQLFSAVFSDFFLFEELLGLDSPGLDESARTYLEKLQLETKVKVEDGRLSTIELSQGQRKRLALLTAYLEDRPIYLFDEWAADQDPEFKELFYLHLLPELRRRNKTVLVISHDDRYYEVADRILKLERGVVTYEGSMEGYVEAMTRRGSRLPYTQEA